MPEQDQFLQVLDRDEAEIEHDPDREGAAEIGGRMVVMAEAVTVMLTGMRVTMSQGRSSDAPRGGAIYRS